MVGEVVENVGIVVFLLLKALIHRKKNVEYIDMADAH